MRFFAFSGQSVIDFIYSLDTHKTPQKNKTLEIRMHKALTAGEAEFRLTFGNKMTYEFAAELEDKIIDALRRYTHFEVDLSRVLEIDLCGSHLLGLLKCFTDKGLVIVATSPAVDRAYESFVAPPPCAAKPAPIASSRKPVRSKAVRRLA